MTNLTSGGQAEQMVSLCEAGALPAMCGLLAQKDEKTVIVILEGLQNLLATADKHGGVESVCMTIEECDGLDKIEVLQTHENEEIYKKALKIIETYFVGEVSAIL